MKTLYIGVPAHDGKVEVAFFFGALSVEKLISQEEKTPVQWSFNSGESLVPRSRNNLAHTFLNSICFETGEPFTHFMMIDTDMEFDANHVKKLFDACDDDHPIVAGVAPIKNINWPSVKIAAMNGAPAEELEYLATRNVVNRIDNYPYDEDPNFVVPVRYCGTGMICIAREVLVKFAESYPDLLYYPDYKIGTPPFDDNLENGVTAFFDTEICKEERRYLSEDYTFCRRASDLGFKTFVHRGVTLGHVGKITYRPNRNVV